MGVCDGVYDLGGSVTVRSVECATLISEGNEGGGLRI